MISQKDMLNIICTEAIEAEPRQLVTKEESELPTINYDLRLVRKEDGTLEWRD